MRVANPIARAFYEIESVREGWASRELERQIASMLFERLSKSRDKKKGSPDLFVGA
jgi:predicted nuclease of restriction endonuclease-like (RecB) superfamily